MFEGCTSLTKAPELPAKTLVEGCYAFMFDGCKSLVTAPELSATTLADYCYEGMFSGCTSLNYLKVSFDSWDAFTGSTTDWVEDVSSAGRFCYKAGSGLDVSTKDDSHVPANFTPETF